MLTYNIILILLWNFPSKSNRVVLPWYLSPLPWYCCSSWFHYRRKSVAYHGITVVPITVQFFNVQSGVIDLYCSVHTDMLILSFL